MELCFAFSWISEFEYFLYEVEHICGQFNLQIYLYTLNISILHTQAADSFKVGLQGRALVLIVSEQLKLHKYKKMIYDSFN